MGFICIVQREEMDMKKIEDVLLEAYTGPDLVREHPKLYSGFKLIVGSKQMFFQLKSKKVVDVVMEPGCYIYHADAPASQLVWQYAEIVENGLECYPNINEDIEIVCLGTPEQITSPEQLRNLFWKKESETEKQESAPQPVKYCPECGKELSGLAYIKFCPKCGKKL